MGTERDWNAFWEEKPFKIGWVYGAANETLTQYAVDFIRKRRSPDVLDLACWDGRYTLPLSSHAKVVAMDISCRALSYLGQSIEGNHENIVTEEADIFEVLGQDRAYDLIMCSWLIEELALPRQGILINGLKKWVRERGMIVLRYVTEKSLSPESSPEKVVDHDALVREFKEWWNIEVESLDTNFRQAQVGRVIDGQYVRRYFRPATLIVTRGE